MNQEHRPDIPSRLAKEAGTDHTLVFAKARYEQSHPGRSQSSNQQTQSINPHTGMTLSHDDSGITDAGGSTYSYDSARDLTEYFREINGRKFSSRASTYALPADETEFWRLDKQHTAFLVGLGELYPCPDLVESVLAPREGENITILDIGCGTGTWAISMARRFPHAQVLGIDLAPIPTSPEQLPSNIRFEIGDVNLGLIEHGGEFDLVHLRCVGGGLPNYAQAITYAAQCVKPTGLLLVLDLDLQLCAEDRVSCQKMATSNQPDGSWLQRYMYEFRHAYSVNGTDIFEAEEMLDRGLWGHSLLDGCGAGSLYIPVGPWAKSIDLEEAQRLGFGGVLIRQNLRNALRGFQTLMKKNGIPQDILDEWVTKCDTELDSLSTHSWLRLRMLWGQRNAKNLVGAPTGTLPLDLRPSTWKGHRQVHVYHSTEDSLGARTKRFDTSGELVEPLVLTAT